MGYVPTQNNILKHTSAEFLLAENYRSKIDCEEMLSSFPGGRECISLARFLSIGKKQQRKLLRKMLTCLPWFLKPDIRLHPVAFNFLVITQFQAIINKYAINKHI
uniref:Uncharacterized protein n=1 Tax=Micrurus lemniscatus lemniscatus TaxID=129467 RepID=A0A2D4HRN5_MICLE